MKKSLLLIATVFTSFLSFSQVGLEGIVVEKYYVSDIADSTDAGDNGAVYPLHVGSTTYRVYANLLPGYKVIQMFGSPQHTLNVHTSTAFYNDPNYGFKVYQGTSVNNTKKNTTLIDSYLTIGGVANGLCGVLKTEDTDGTIGNNQGILANNDATAGLMITGIDGVDGLMPGAPILPNVLGITTELDIFDQTVGNDFTTNGAAIAALGGMEGVTPSNHVLLGQFTTDGVFSFRLNLQLSTPVAGESQIFVADSALTGEFVDTTLVYTSLPPVIDLVEANGVVSDVDFSAYPNPCDNQLTLIQSNNQLDRVSMKVLDLTGRVVMNDVYWSAKHTIDTSNLPNGFYTVQLERKGQIHAVKFVKK
ncbi:MAG: T9SS type A sorting domain-containing protein [Sediminibacterium sp.]